MDSDDYHDLLIKESGLPNILLTLAPVFIPVILIAGVSFASLLMDTESSAYQMLSIFGGREVAMFIGVLLMFLLAVKYKDAVLTNHASNSSTKTVTLSETVFGSWVVEGLQVALMPLMITAMGGGFSAIIKANPEIEDLGNARLSISPVCCSRL